MGLATQIANYISSRGSTDAIFNDHAEMDAGLTQLCDEILGLQATDTWDASSIADGDEEAKEVTVTGAVLGDFALASLSIDVADLVINAAVTAADTVTVILANNTGGAVDLDSATVRVKVFK